MQQSVVRGGVNVNKLVFYALKNEIGTDHPTLCVEQIEAMTQQFMGSKLQYLHRTNGVIREKKDVKEKAASISSTSRRLEKFVSRKTEDIASCLSGKVRYIRLLRPDAKATNSEGNYSKVSVEKKTKKENKN